MWESVIVYLDKGRNTTRSGEEIILTKCINIIGPGIVYCYRNTITRPGIEIQI